jgi:MFS family permease
VYSPVGSAYIADIAPVDLRGRYQAAYAFTYSLGLMLAPIGGTLLYTVSPSALWLSCLVLCIAGAGLLAGAWMREEGANRRGASTTGAFLADDAVGRRD